MTLRAEGLGARFADGAWGLRGVDLELTGSGFVVLTGHNGSGKTLLCRHLLGLETPSEGRVALDGADIRRDPAALRRRVGFVFQEPEHQILGLTVAEDVEWTPRRYGWPRARVERARGEALARVGLAGRGGELCANLSGGEKRRLAVAGVLAAEPELLVLDEPFNDLDWPGVRALLEILVELPRQGVGLLVVTHDLEKCLALADRLVVMDGGRLAADGRPAELWDRLPGLGLRRGPGRLEDLSWLA